MRLAVTILITSGFLISMILLAQTMAATQLQFSNNVTVNKSSPIDHLIIIMLENRSLNGTFGLLGETQNAAHIINYINQYSLSAEYYDNGVICGSISSYIAITNANPSALPTPNCGQCNTSDTGSCTVNTETIMDRLDKAGKTWKSYFEDMPTPCDLTSYPTGIDNYAIGHNPFVYYAEMQSDSVRCNSHVVPAGDLDSCPGVATSASAIQKCDKYLLQDLNSANPPNYVWLGTNIWNNMYVHFSDGASCTGPPPAQLHEDLQTFQGECVSQSDVYLQYLFPAIMATTAWTNGDTGIFLTWDEPGPDVPGPVCPTPNPSPPSGSDACQFPGVWIGPMFKTGYVSHNVYTFYSLMKTIENYWGLLPLTNNDGSASPMTEFFK